MTEAEFIARIAPHLPRGCRASDEALSIVTEAIAAFPESAALWLAHGRVTVAATNVDVSDSAVRSFEMALVFDPTLADAHEALGQYHGVKDNPGKAVAFYTRAAELRSRPSL